MGKKKGFSFRSSGHKPPKRAAPPLPPPSGGGGKPKKKIWGARLWMRFDNSGKSKLVEMDKNSVIRIAAIPARDLRILGPLSSHSFNILAREKATVVNLEFIKAIVTAEEVLVLDPLRQEVIPFVDQLRHQLSQKGESRLHGSGLATIQEIATIQENKMQVSSFQGLPVSEAVEGSQRELPFELQVLEIALEVVCSFLDSGVANLERDAYPVIDELAKSVSTKNLEHVRSLKSYLTHLLARVQKVRDEIEHLLDDNEDMAHLYLTRKLNQHQQSEAAGSTGNAPSLSFLRRNNSNRSGSLVTNFFGDDDVEDLEMLLEAYFTQLDGMCNKILTVREYIDDTEDYVNIQLDNQRNELIQLQLIMNIAAFVIAFETYLAGCFGMNIPNQLNDADGIFGIIVGSMTIGCLILFLLVLGYARWKNLTGT